MDCEYFEKIPGTDLDEQYVVFGLIDLENLIFNLLTANLITKDEYDDVYSLAVKIGKRCGLRNKE